MSRETSGTWCQARKMRSRIGWEIWLGADEWALITDVHIRVDDVLIAVEDGTTFRARSLCRCHLMPETHPPALRPSRRGYRHKYTAAHTRTGLPFYQGSSATS